MGRIIAARSLADRKTVDFGVRNGSDFGREFVCYSNVDGSVSNPVGVSSVQFWIGDNAAALAAQNPQAMDACFEKILRYMKSQRVSIQQPDDGEFMTVTAFNFVSDTDANFQPRLGGWIGQSFGEDDVAVIIANVGETSRPFTFDVTSDQYQVMAKRMRESAKEAVYNWIGEVIVP
ncbi:hypothetical protein [Vibrio coralliilyticus]|uniref:Uncharacterized protein n=1 Tax=Vibrio coralliilyticus TaxID=190893 RepID=A0AAP7DGT4_9VIBR|nr:hypothetical protein [Vibrio coralliilyticus]NOJ26335.1 hypothetical protein [Vibrio coralliilyticus]